MAVDVWEYIWSCLVYAKYVTSAQSVPFIPLQTKDAYKLIEIDFISPFNKFTYGNTYIYKLIDYFSKYMYFYLITKVDINDFIILFNHYLQANL